MTPIRLVAAMCLALYPIGPAHAQDPLAGDWSGTLNVAGTRLRLVFHIEAANEQGERKAALDSPDQGASGLPVATVELVEDSVRMTLPAIGGTYTGRLAPDAQAIDGTWTQGGASFPLKLEKSATPIEPPRRPQEPAPPFPYRSEEVTFDNDGADGVTLAGTLTLPEGAGPFPAVVLVSGSGPQDRNEELLGHKPFLVLSDALTRRGIAVLRYDDRGVGASTGSFQAATSEDFASDALAAVAFLKGRDDVDPAKIGIVGHSEGGLIAPIAAVRSEDVAFIVLLAGPGVPGAEILKLQGELIARANGASEETIEQSRAALLRMFEILRTTPDSAAAHQAIAAELRAQIAAMTPEQREQAGISAATGVEAIVAAQAANVVSPWFRFFLTYDPAATLRQVDVPVLAIFGEKDLQVPPSQNLGAVRSALEAGGNTDVTVVEMPGLNHLFQPATTGSPTEYAQIETTMSEDVLRMVADWILERFGPAR